MSERDDTQQVEPIASRYFDAQIAEMGLEAELDDALLSAMGIDPNEPTEWPCGNLVYDYYDMSFELRGTRPDWTPTPEQLAATWALGFVHGWVVYTDSTERYYSPKYPAGVLKSSTRGGASEASRRERMLMKQIASCPPSTGSHEEKKKEQTP